MAALRCKGFILAVSKEIDELIQNLNERNPNRREKIVLNTSIF